MREINAHDKIKKGKTSCFVYIYTVGEGGDDLLPVLRDKATCSYEMYLIYCTLLFTTGIWDVVSKRFIRRFSRNSTKLFQIGLDRLLKKIEKNLLARIKIIELFV